MTRHLEAKSTAFEKQEERESGYKIADSHGTLGRGPCIKICLLVIVMAMVGKGRWETPSGRLEWK